MTVNLHMLSLFSSRMAEKPILLNHYSWITRVVTKIEEYILKFIFKFRILKFFVHRPEIYTKQAFPKEYTHKMNLKIFTRKSRSTNFWDLLTISIVISGIYSWLYKKQVPLITPTAKCNTKRKATLNRYLLSCIEGRSE